MCMICGNMRNFILTKLSGRLPLIMNLFACVLMLICIGLRFYYVSLNAVPQNRVAFFVILSIYELIFIGLIIAAEFKSERPRLYFDFLDSKVGRGGFIAFTMLLILEVSLAAEIIMGIVVFVIALIGIISGWYEDSDGVNANKPPVARPANNAAQQRPNREINVDLNMDGIAASAVAEYAKKQFNKLGMAGGKPQA